MNRSAWWFLLPIFLGIIGSAIAWAKIRDSGDHELLRWIMIFGAVQTIVIAFGGVVFDTEYDMIMNDYDTITEHIMRESMEQMAEQIVNEMRDGNIISESMSTALMALYCPSSNFFLCTN